MTPERMLAVSIALRKYRQWDTDGVMVAVSRQACDEAADFLEILADPERDVEPAAARPRVQLTPDAERFRREALAHLAETSEYPGVRDLALKELAATAPASTPVVVVTQAGVPPEVAKLVRWVRALMDEIYIPERNCSCHVIPPCSDCTNNGGLREVYDEVKAALGPFGGVE